MADDNSSNPAPTLENFGEIVRGNIARAEQRENAEQREKAKPAAIGRGPQDTEPDPDMLDEQADEAEGDGPEGGDPEDPLEAELHGHKGSAILEALRKGALPPELLAEIKATARVNGQDVAVTLKEALEGYQRTSDYTRAKKELREKLRGAEARLDAVNDLLTSWNDGAKLLAGLRRIGKMDAFHEAAVSYAREMHEDEVARRENPAAYEARMLARKEREAREELERRLAERPEQRDDSATRELAQRLGPLVLAAFGELQIKDTRFARDRFSDHFRALYDEDTDLDQLVRSAAQATHEELSDIAVRYHAQQGGNGNGAQKPTAPLAGKPAAAPATGRVQPPKRMTPSEMADYLAARRKRFAR